MGVIYLPEKVSYPRSPETIRAALEVGSQLEAIYAKHAPADHRRVFRTGWDKGMQTCVKSLRY